LQPPNRRQAPRTTAGCSPDQGPPRSWWMALGWLKRKCVRLCVSGLVPDDASPREQLRTQPPSLLQPPGSRTAHISAGKLILAQPAPACRRMPALPHKRWGQLYCPPSPYARSLIANDAHRSYMRLRPPTRRENRTALERSSGPGQQAAGGHLRVHVANQQQWPQPRPSPVQHVGLSLPTFCLGTSPPANQRRATRRGRCSTICGSFRPGSEGSGSASSFGAVILLSGNDVMPLWHVFGNETEGRGAGCHDA